MVGRKDPSIEVERETTQPRVVEIPLRKSEGDLKESRQTFEMHITYNDEEILHGNVLEYTLWHDNTLR